MEDREGSGESLGDCLRVLDSPLTVPVQAHHSPELAWPGVPEPVQAGPATGQEEPPGQRLRADHSHGTCLGGREEEQEQEAEVVISHHWVTAALRSGDWRLERVS